MSIVEWAAAFDLCPPGPDKVMLLAEAVRSAIRPGMRVHFAFTHNRRPATRVERMVLTTADLVAEKVHTAHHSAILSGLGACNLAAWIAHGMLAGRGLPVSLVAELGMAGYAPRPWSRTEAPAGVFFSLAIRWKGQSPASVTVRRPRERRG